jgi:ABC-type phosphate/phosphonate transport system substrate-binding protein
LPDGFAIHVTLMPSTWRPSRDRSLPRGVAAQTTLEQRSISMFGYKASLLALAVSASLCALPGTPARGGENLPAHKDLVRIGLVNTLFRDTPEVLVQVMMEPFSALMEAQTGIKGQLVMAGDPLDLAQRLKEDKLQLGVFHGVEFGWAQQKYPELRPLMLAVNKQVELHAFLVVRNDSEANGFTDLRQHSLAVPRRSREHCHLFLHRCCRDNGSDSKRFFTQITTPPGVETALDDLLRGKVQACLVDSIGLESYKREKPGCFARLKTIKVSETFPAAVVAYAPGVLDEATLQKFREGMAKANETAVGRQMLAGCRLTGFEPVPADYQKLVDEIIKVYPAPAPAKSESVTQRVNKTN